MLNLKRRSLKTHLIAIAIMCIIPTFGVGAVAAWLGVNNYQRFYNDRLSEAAKSIALLLNREIENYVFTLRTLSYSPLLDVGVETNVQEFYAHAQRSAEEMRSAIALIGPDLALRFNTRTGLGSGAENSIAEVAQATFATGLPIISDLVQGSFSQRPGIIVTIPVIRQGRTIAVIGTRIDPVRLSQLIASANISEHSIATIVDGGNTVVARSDDHALYSGKPASDWYIEAKSGAIGGIASGLSLGGSEVKLAFNVIPGTPRWTVAVFEPTIISRAQWMSPVVFLAIGGLVVLCLALCFTIWLGQRVLSPISMLREQADVVTASVGNGNPEAFPLHTPAFGITEFEKLRLAISHSSMALAASEKRNRALAEAGAAALWRARADGQIVESRGWELLTGQKPEQLSGNGWIDALHPDDVAATVKAWTKAIASKAVVSVAYRVRAADGRWLWHRARGVPILNDAGEISEWYGVVVNIHDQRSAESALQSSEARMRALVDQAPDAIVVMDDKGIVREFNKSAERIFQYPAQEVIGCNISMLMPQQHAGHHDGYLGQYGAAGERHVIGAVAPVDGLQKGGQPIPLEASISEWNDATGARFFTGVLRDITERRAAEHRQAMLSREVDHRAKNVLTIVQSVIRLTKAETLKEFKSAVEARVFALARVHSLLAEGGWADAELHTIAARELAAHVDTTRRDAAISMSGPSYRLNSNSVQPMAMVLHELAINAVKHGALSTHQGRVELQWQTDRSARTLFLRWQEHGGPHTRAPSKHGFGSRLIEASVTRQLGGAVSWTWLDTGLVCEITLSDDKVGGVRNQEGG